MINRTNIVIPKKYEKYIDEIIGAYEGYWCYLNKGYSCPDERYGELHIIQEESQKELLRAIRDIEECHCEECEQFRKENEQENER